MADRLGADYIYQNLSNDATVTGLVSTSIWNGNRIPETETSFDTIKYYRAEPYDATLGYMAQTWSIDCRSQNEETSKDIALAVIGALNRIQYSYGGYMYFGTCSMLPAIPPADAQDCYNTPVTFRLRRR